jgi:hypothetical protein
MNQAGETEAPPRNQLYASLEQAAGIGPRQRIIREFWAQTPDISKFVNDFFGVPSRSRLSSEIAARGVDDGLFVVGEKYCYPDANKCWFGHRHSLAYVIGIINPPKKHGSGPMLMLVEEGDEWSRGYLVKRPEWVNTRGECDLS